ncbi:hypothetical protein [Halorubellus litoreus]|uniref:Uncharacterized protein n=1 Tax=Halorubellus litoreus TaxID=755308 RepID=A0ABD5V9N1_9EURY
MTDSANDSDPKAINVGLLYVTGFFLICTLSLFIYHVTTTSVSALSSISLLSSSNCSPSTVYAGLSCWSRSALVIAAVTIGLPLFALWHRLFYGPIYTLLQTYGIFP